MSNLDISEYAAVGRRQKFKYFTIQKPRPGPSQALVDGFGLAWFEKAKAVLGHAKAGGAFIGALPD